MSKQTRAKLKSIFGRKSNGAESCPAENKCDSGLILSEEILSEICPSNSVINRARALKDFADVVLARKLEKHAIDRLLVTIDDLLDASVCVDGRQAALYFLICLTTGQYQYLDILRTQIFRIIIHHDVEEDLDLRITLIKVLTDNGKDISYCEQIGGFLVQFMNKALLSSKADEFLQLLVNILHYNSSFLDNGMISAIVFNTCQFCDNIDNDHFIENCLLLLDASVRYGGLTSNGICPLIRTLCWTVNIEKFCELSWTLMRKLTGTNLGHTAIYLMCQLLEDSRNFSNTTLLRGAIFFTGMCIWGSKRVTSLYYEPIHVLPSFKSCLFSADTLVAKEISVSLQRLVKKFGPDQEIITWDIILDIMEMLLKLAEGPETDEMNTLFTTVHGILSTIEQLYVEDKFYGCPKRLFQILTSCAKDRPIDSVIILLEYYQKLINPSNVDWLDILKTLYKDYFCKESRSLIRIKVIKIIAATFKSYQHKYEEDMINEFINNNFQNICDEDDCTVRLEISQLFSTMMIQCSSDSYPTILNITESLIYGIFNKKKIDDTDIIDNTDIKVSVHGLIDAFKEKLYSKNNSFVVKIFTILFNHINDHYMHNIKGSSAGLIRRDIFDMLLSLRVNDKHSIGFVGQSSNKFSNHVIFKMLQSEEFLGGSIYKISLDIHDFQNAFDALLKCLKNENNWLVLECVLKKLGSQLSNKNLYAYCQCDINRLCSALCNLVNDKMYLNNVQNCPPNMGISELRNLIFPILSIIATYNTLSRERQFELVNCIDFGLNTHCAHTCVSCLSICILEMEQVMIRLLPSILVKLSQISATIQLAIPILEFLSTLKEISSLYVNFVEEQFMSIFAMALSYTDSYRFSPYIVTLAHQIIADWFTRCRLIYRKGFVSLIEKGLKSSALIKEKDNSIEKNNDIKQFHEEMTLICLDMMARYSYSNSVKSPTRSTIMDMLLSTGTSKTWVAANMLITITTSSNIPGHCSSCSVKFDTADKIEFQSLDLDRKFDCMKLFSEPSMSIERKGIKSLDSSIIEEKYNGSSNKHVSSNTLGKDHDSFSNADYKTKIPSTSDSWFSNKLISRSLNPCINADDKSDPNESKDSYCLHENNLSAFDQSKQTCPVPDMTGPLDCKQNISYDELNHQDDSKHYDSTLITVNKKQQGIAVTTYQTGKDVDNTLLNMNSFMQPKSSCRSTGCYKSCECSCIGWAEVFIRRPTGNNSWIMEIDNRKDDCIIFPDSSIYASSMDYLDLYKKLSCSISRQETFDKFNEGCSFRPSLSRSQSCDSILKSADNPVPLLSKNLLTDHLNYSKIKNEKKNDSCKSSTSGTNTKSFPGYGSDNLPEPQMRNSINPNHIFLQLFSSLGIEEDYLISVEQTEVIDRAMKILDRIPTANTHKFGVLYVAKGQCNSEVDILSNQYGSVRYADFLSGLGNIINLNESHSIHVFTGGLDSRGKDGNFAYHWKDETTQIIFHTATLMPNKETDSKCVSKKLHIGNNFVTIIYDDTIHGYEFGTIKGQFNYAEIVIRPLEYASNKVFVRYKDSIDGFNYAPKIVSDKNLSLLVRQLAIHTNMAVVTELTEKKLTNAFTSNWLERLRQIKRIKTKWLAEVKQKDTAQKNEYT